MRAGAVSPAASRARGPSPVAANSAETSSAVAWPAMAAASAGRSTDRCSRCSRTRVRSGLLRRRGTAARIRSTGRFSRSNSMSSTVVSQSPDWCRVYGQVTSTAPNCPFGHVLAPPSVSRCPMPRPCTWTAISSRVPRRTWRSLRMMWIGVPVLRSRWMPVPSGNASMRWRTGALVLKLTACGVSMSQMAALSASARSPSGYVRLS